MVTHGAEGSEAFAADGRKISCPARKVDHVIDTTGAGDAFAGGLTDAWLRGLEMGQALARGSAFGARAVQTEGSVLRSLPA